MSPASAQRWQLGIMLPERAATSCCCPGSVPNIEYWREATGGRPAYVCCAYAANELGLCVSCAVNCDRPDRDAQYRNALRENVRRHNATLPSLARLAVSEQ